ncbi:MAG: undecaprenyldiphospho-muramoylpentapeptide beta-N-acetylglucosaminyltransferase [Acidobacteria bacterium RBG_13_68_16]|nr:MAG: undecaprenyldiphospho-muramoylpentapeptide beta-N-acetylglucosaminyltransferase [Acidobacteria bacterium RBG_13_68_16]
MTRVAIAGGGTGGHLFPGLAVAEELARAGVAVFWLGARRGLEAIRVPQAGIPLRLLAVTGAAARSPGAQLCAALRVAPATLQAATYLLRQGAGAVLAVGGYASLPGGVAAGMLGIPVILQEQNALPGLSNRLLAPWCVTVACGFEAAVSAFASLPARWTGNPVRAEFFSVPSPPLEPLAVLVIGGSQGSVFLNALLPETLARLIPGTPLPRVIHQSGERWEAEVRQRYASAGVAAEVVPFLERPAEALARAALVVARAGALTLSELAAARRAALLVPFAAAAGGHQLANARAYAATDAAEVLEEREATPGRTAALLAQLLASPARLVDRGRAAARLARPDAAREVARLVLEAARSEGRGGAL